MDFNYNSLVQTDIYTCVRGCPSFVLFIFFLFLSDSPQPEQKNKGWENPAIMCRKVAYDGLKLGPFEVSLLTSSALYGAGRVGHLSICIKCLNHLELWKNSLWALKNHHPVEKRAVLKYKRRLIKMCGLEGRSFTGMRAGIDTIIEQDLWQQLQRHNFYSTSLKHPETWR